MVEEMRAPGLSEKEDNQDEWQNRNKEERLLQKHLLPIPSFQPE